VRPSKVAISSGRESRPGKVDQPPGSAKGRALGMPAPEDNLVGVAMARSLEQVYEKDFIDDSYGFRPGRGCRDALRALWRVAPRNPVRPRCVSPAARQSVIFPLRGFLAECKISPVLIGLEGDLLHRHGDRTDESIAAGFWGLGTL